MFSVSHSFLGTRRAKGSDVLPSPAAWARRCPRDVPGLGTGLCPPGAWTSTWSSRPQLRESCAQEEDTTLPHTTATREGTPRGLT